MREERLVLLEQMAEMESRVQLEHQETLDLPVPKENGETEENPGQEVCREKSGLRVHLENQAAMEILDYQELEVFLDQLDHLEIPYEPNTIEEMKRFLSDIL